NVKGLMVKLAKEFKTTKNKIWSVIDLDHPEYNLYARMDTILAARLSKALFPLVPSVSRKLIGFAHDVGEICAYMERNGFLLDVEHAAGRSKRLEEDEEYWTEVAAELGVENVNSTEQGADGLEAMGVKTKDRAPSGKRKVGKKLLESLQKE